MTEGTVTWAERIAAPFWWFTRKFFRRGMTEAELLRRQLRGVRQMMAGIQDELERERERSSNLAHRLQESERRLNAAQKGLKPHPTDQARMAQLLQQQAHDMQGLQQQSFGQFLGGQQQQQAEEAFLRSLHSQQTARAFGGIFGELFW